MQSKDGSDESFIYNEDHWETHQRFFKMLRRGLTSRQTVEVVSETVLSESKVALLEHLKPYLGQS